MLGANGVLEGRDQYRVVILSEANACLEVLATKVNDGFETGAVTKSDVANFVFLNLARLISDADVRAIRAIHFDDKKMLGSLLKTETELPEDLKKLIRAHFGVGDKEKKRPLRTNSELPLEGPNSDAKLPLPKLVG